MRNGIFVMTLAVSMIVSGSAVAQETPIVTCSGTLIEVDMNPKADFPMAVIYDNTDSLASRTCVLDLGHVGHWPLRGVCWLGERCVLTGPYFKKIGNTYYMRQWNKAEAPGHSDLEIPAGR